MKFRTILLGCIAALSLAGCARADTATNHSAADAGSPVTGDSIVVRFDAEPDSLNPLISTSAYANYIAFGVNNSGIYESLLAVETADWITPKPLLAEARPEISTDHLSYTFTLRQGVHWHDGTPLTPEDVVFTFKALMCPGVDSGRLRGFFTGVSNVESLEGRKIRFTMSSPYFMNESAIGNYVAIVPKHIFDPQGNLDSFAFMDVVAELNHDNPKLAMFGKALNANPAGRAPIGTGPYKFEKWNTGKEVDIVRNDQYWGQKAYLDRIIYRFITDAGAALTALKSGEIDLNTRLLPLQYAQQTSGPGFDQNFSKTPYTLPQYYFIGWNQDRPYFKDKRVRQALTMLIDRQQMVDTLRFGLGQVAASHFNSSSADYNPSVTPLPYDPKRAAELLDESGWKDTNRDGIRDKDGKPFSFELLTSTSEFSNQLSPIIKEEFRKAGIDVREKHLESATFINAMRDHAFDALASGWASALVTDPYQIWHSSSIANRGSNVISFRNKTSDNLLERARTEFDQEKRRQLYWKWQEIIQDEQPYLFLFYPQEAAAYSKRFKGVEFVPSRPGFDLNTWYVPRSLQKYGR